MMTKPLELLKSLKTVKAAKAPILVKTASTLKSSSHLEDAKAPSAVKDAALYSRVRAEADLIFLARSSIYRSAWIVREYKKRGGLYKSVVGVQQDAVGLRRWFAEKWVDVNRPKQPCGRRYPNDSQKYPLCRPTVRVSAATPLTVAEIGRRRIMAANRRKQVIRHSGVVHF